MPGMGPAPKPSGKRQRRNADPIGATTIEFVKGDQPPLEESVSWPDATIKWWEMWEDSPLSDRFMATDWAFLQDTALLHAAVWGRGEFQYLPELRIRVAKFGATPEDRARLRIQYAEADAGDGGERPRAASARARRGHLAPVTDITGTPSKPE